MIVLTLNSGSSSLKFGRSRVDGSELQTLTTGQQDGGQIRAQDGHGSALVGTPVPADTPDVTISAIASLVVSAQLPAPEAIGHRIVHGGARLRAHCLIDDEVERDLEAATALSPLHAPAALATIRLAKNAWPGIPQAVCLDTTFHAAMPDIARVLPLARELRVDGVERFGFHGLSCESIVQQLGEALPSRLIVAHLGSGASVTAVRDGRSIDTSMGLTPSGGIIMATRSGDLDPGILIYLLREHGYDAASMEDLIDHRSGLKGISGLSGDLRQLHQAVPSDADAALAIAMFCLSVAKAIAGMIVTLGDVDAVVFTGGIGEHDATVRGRIGDHLGSLGIRVAASSKSKATGRIDASGSRCQVYVLPSLEDEQISRHTGRLVTEARLTDGQLRCTD